MRQLCLCFLLLYLPSTPQFFSKLITDPACFATCFLPRFFYFLHRTAEVKHSSSCRESNIRDSKTLFFRGRPFAMGKLHIFFTAQGHKKEGHNFKQSPTIFAKKNYSSYWIFCRNERSQLSPGWFVTELSWKLNPLEFVRKRIEEIQTSSKHMQPLLALFWTDNWNLTQKSAMILPYKCRKNPVWVNDWHQGYLKRRDRIS